MPAPTATRLDKMASACRPGSVSGTGAQIGAKLPSTSPIAPIAIIVTAKNGRLAVFTSIGALQRRGVRQIVPIENALSSNGSLFAAERRRGDSQVAAV